MTQEEPKSSMLPLVMIVIVIALVAVGVALALLRHREEKVEAAGAAQVEVRATAVALKDVPDVVEYSGLIEAEADVSLAAEQGGRIEWLGAEKGESVKAGQPLLRVDSRLYAAAAERAEADARQASADLRRLEDLRRTGAVSESELDNMRTRADMARIGLQEARVQLDKCEQKSPIDGVVVDRTVEVGEFATPGAPAFHLAAIDRVKVRCDIPERDIFAVKEGREVPFTIASLPGRTFIGKITFIAPAAEKRSNTFRVEMLMDNADHLLKPGIIVNVALTRRVLKNALTVPLEALIPTKGQYVVYVVERGHAVRRVVNLAVVAGTQAVVQDGLKAGDRVVVDGQRRLSDGVPVSEAEAEAAK